MDEITELLETLQGINFDNLTSRLWVVKKNSRGGVNSYRALSAAIEGLDVDFNQALKKFFFGLGDVYEPIREVSPYSALTIDTDEDRALIHSADETDFGKIIEKISEGADNAPVNDIKQFNNAWALVVEFRHDQDKFFAFSKIKGGWNLKKRTTVKNLVFEGGHFKKIQADNIFSFRDYFDFVSHEGIVFIRDKANYELGLNIREGLEAKKEVLTDVLAENGIIASVEDFRVAIGTNKTLLRRLVAAEETRYFEDQQFIEDMKSIVDEHGWQLDVDGDGKFVIDETNIDLFLKLINDKRFISLIRKQMVDADAVQVVERADQDG